MCCGKENSNKIVARRYRNRRIGEFLKELELTEGRCTGIPKIRAAMAKNGSPPARFSTDEGRTYRALFGESYLWAACCRKNCRIRPAIWSFSSSRAKCPVSSR